jgi:predicted membrane channel-forming protein YqfA (hemolysin III family)
VVGSRLLPLALAGTALLSGAIGLGGLAFWAGLLAVSAAAAAAFVAASDALEGRPARLQAVTSGLALALLVLGSAARANALTGGAAPHLATWALLAAMLAYSVPVVVWVLEPVRVPRRRTRPRRRLRPAEVEELLARAA